jgi:hypothetical protein
MEGDTAGENTFEGEFLKGVTPDEEMADNNVGDEILAGDLQETAMSEELPGIIECCCEPCIRAYFGRREPNDLCRIEDRVMDHIEEVADLYVSWLAILISSL